jgi:hypothetical protein
LNLKVPKPSFANARSSSAFGFHAAAIPETDHAQDGEHQLEDTDMVADVDDSADKTDDRASMYGSDVGMAVINEGVDDGHNLGMIHFLFFNTLTFFART